MLTRLVIQDVVLIDRLTVPFEAGLNVFTGETGAGKSILLDSLSLALGARGDMSLIRKGADNASVTAVFEGALPEPLSILLQEQGLTVDEPLLLRRTLGRDGKSRAFLNDQPIGITLLRAIGEHLLEIHGQFDTHGLLNPSNHRALLDAFADHASLRHATSEAHRQWKQAEKAYQTAQAERERSLSEEAFLRASAEELDDLSPRQGETESLADRRSLLQHREKILEAVQIARNALAGDKGAENSTLTAGKALARITDKAQDLAPVLTLIDQAGATLAEASGALEKYAQDIDLEANSLDHVEERLFKIRAVARKHNVDPETLTELQADIHRRLALLSDRGDEIQKLAKAVNETAKAYRTKAKALSLSRRKAAETMAQAIRTELPPLKLERATLSVRVDPLPADQWGGDGMDRVSFEASTNAGVPAGPLHKMASGGELSRFMLALKVVLAKADPVPTLVFDEVDAGIGGATAAAVGARLARLGRDVQVLVVTHSPQVAALGNHHLRVEKMSKSQSTTTQVTALTASQRVEEIARMLSGNEITPAAREAARSLLHPDGGAEQTVVPVKKKRAS